MECACIDASYDGDMPTFYNRKTVKARKEHKCCECGDIIKTGSEYEKAVGRWGKDFDVYKTCADCLSIGHAFFCGGWPHSIMWEEISEYLYPGECLSKLMLKITVGARGKILKWLEDSGRLEE